MHRACSVADALAERFAVAVSVVGGGTMKPLLMFEPEEVLADLKTRGSTAVIDDEFARDIEEGIKAHREPWTPPSWE